MSAVTDATTTQVVRGHGQFVSWMVAAWRTREGKIGLGILLAFILVIAIGPAVAPYGAERHWRRRPVHRDELGSPARHGQPRS